MQKTNCVKRIGEDEQRRKKIYCEIKGVVNRFLESFVLTVIFYVIFYFVFFIKH